MHQLPPSIQMEERGEEEERGKEEERGEREEQKGGCEFPW